MTDAPRYQVHSSYIWLGGVQAALSILVALFAITFGFALDRDMRSIIMNNSAAVPLLVAGVLALFLVIAGLLTLLQYFSYKHLWYELGPNEFSLYSGILSKKRVHVPYQRVQSVNQRATLIQRFAGVCTVHIDTAGGAQNKAITVPYLRKADAEWLRTQLFACKQAVLNGQEVLINQAARVVAGAGTVALGYATPNLAPPTGQPVLDSSAPVPVTTVTAQASTTPYAGGAGNVLDAPAELMSDLRGVFGGAEMDLGAVSYSHRLTNKELVFTGMSNSAGVAAAIITVLATIGGLVFTVFGAFLGEQIGNRGAAIITDLAAKGLIPLIAGPLIVLIAVIYGASILGTCVVYGGFTARRRGSRIEVEHGILQHRFDGVDIDRVQSVIIRQSFIRRLIGYCEVSLGKIDALTAEQQQNQNQGVPQRGLVVHPFVKTSRVPEVLAGLVPEFADVPAEAEALKLPPLALRRALLRRCIVQGNGFWIAVTIAVAHLCFNLFMQSEPVALAIINAVAVALYVLCLLIVVLDGIAAVLWFRRSSFAYNKRFMQVTNGGFATETVSFPRKKIQFGYIRSNPFQRASKVMTINARTAAGVGGTTVSLKDARKEDAEAWLTWLLPQSKAKAASSAMPAPSGSPVAPPAHP